MNAVWLILWVAGLGYGLFSGRGDQLFPAAMRSAGDAVALAITLAAAYAFWSGFLNILARAGVTAALARLLRRPIAWLFPGVTHGSAAAISANMAANALGLGNAATPAGLEAARMLGREGRHHALLMLVIINCSSIQLIPTTVLSLRAAAGSPAPEAIMLPTLIATGMTTAVGIGLGVLLRGKKA